MTTNAEEQLAGFIDKFDPENAALIGYRSTERPSDCIVSIAAAARQRQPKP